MSLTSLLESTPGREAAACLGRLRSHLTLETLRGLSWGHEPLVPPARPGDRPYAALVGTAWDYWLRLYLLRSHGAKREEGLVAEAALEWLTIVEGNPGAGDDSRQLRRAKNLVTQAVGRWRAVLEGHLSPMTGEVMTDAVILGSLDPVFRVKLPAWEEPTGDVVQQASTEIGALAELYLECPDRLGARDQPIWANPAFGKASNLVQGADADIVIGQVLWELKATKHLRYLRLDWAQLAGYYVLSVLGQTPFSIRRVGVYFARFGTQAHIDIADLEVRTDLDGFAQALIQAAVRGRVGAATKRAAARWLTLWRSRRSGRSIP